MWWIIVAGLLLIVALLVLNIFWILRADDWLKKESEIKDKNYFLFIIV